jgi:uridine kinase
MSPRQELLNGVTDTIATLTGNPTLRVGVDGIDGAGKTVLADELAVLLRARGRSVIRASVDGFHNDQATRYRLGRASPEGFFLDSYDYRGLKSALLDPLSPGGSGRYRTAIFDHALDTPVAVSKEQATVGSILLFDGIFLHRPELRHYWDFSIFLHVAFEVSIPRGARRGAGFGSPDPTAPSNVRYIEGQRLYLRACRPWRIATIIIDNSDIAIPALISPADLDRWPL